VKLISTSAARRRNRLGVGSLSQLIKADESQTRGEGTLTKPHRGLTGKRGNGMESGDDADRRRPDESSDDDGDESGVPAWSWDGINCGLLDCSKHGDGSIYRGTQFWHRFYHVADTRESTPPILCLSSSHTIPHLSITPCTSFIICQI